MDSVEPGGHVEGVADRLLVTEVDGSFADIGVAQLIEVEAEERTHRLVVRIVTSTSEARIIATVLDNRARLATNGTEDLRGIANRYGHVHVLDIVAATSVVNDEGNHVVGLFPGTDIGCHPGDVCANAGDSATVSIP